MRYAKIDKFEYVNGEYIGVSLFVQGCTHNCKNCFNPETHNFNDGYEWNEKIENDFLEMANKDYIKRISILGGEPLHPNNIGEVTNLVKKLKLKFPTKPIYLWSGYDYENYISKCEIINYLDYVIDGKFVEELKDLSLRFRGSSNQRIIDIKKTLQANKVILFEE